MCSVGGCDSWRRSAQCFNLPGDPEMRSLWVQFVAKDDEQLFKESSWSGIAVCREHFLEECFEKTVDTDKVQLKPSAVPTVLIKSEEVGEFVDSKLVLGPDPLNTEDGHFGESETVPTPSEHTLFKEETEPLQIQEKHLMNENYLLQLFSHKCPSCSCNLETKKNTVVTLITLTQQCLQCEYRNEFTHQISTSTTGHQSSTASIEVTIESDQKDDKHHSEICAPCKEESEEDRDGTGGITSDDWFPIKKAILAKEDIKKEIEGGLPNQEEEGGDSNDTSSEDFFPIKKPLMAKGADFEGDVSKEKQGGGDGDDASSEDFFPIGKSVQAKEKDTEEDTEEHTEDETEEDTEEDTKVPNYVDTPTEVRRSIKQLCNECGHFYLPNKAHICEYKLKPFVCNTCGKRCRTKLSLKLHCHIHSNSKIHTCKYCYAPFQTKQEKLNHQVTHEDTLDPFQCHACPARFTCFLDRREHLRTHPKPREHRCEECGITFRRRHVLWRHMVVHTGEKPFKCSECDRGFNQPGHLKSHMRLHTGETPYQCPHCDKSFNHNVSLKSHIQRYHPNKRSNNTDDAHDSNDTESDSGDDHGEKEQNADEAKEQETTATAKIKRWSTGRPKGRPKRNFGAESSPKRKKNVCKSQTKKQHDEESEELTDNNCSFDLDEEEQEAEKASRRHSSRLKNYTDPDYKPERKRTKRPSSRKIRRGRVKEKM